MTIELSKAELEWLRMVFGYMADDLHPKDRRMRAALLKRFTGALNKIQLTPSQPRK